MKDFNFYENKMNQFVCQQFWHQSKMISANHIHSIAWKRIPEFIAALQEFVRNLNPVFLHVFHQTAVFVFIFLAAACTLAGNAADFGGFNV